MKTCVSTLACGLASALLVSGCLNPLTLSGFECEPDGTCAAEYSCDLLDNACVTTGDACDDDGRTSLCPDGTARVCDGSTWGACDGPVCADADADGICDPDDTCNDLDGDGLGDGTVGNSGCVNSTTDSNDTDATACADTDNDTCDDCSSGSFDPNDDGLDSDNDGTCDAAPVCEDGDGDGVGSLTNGNPGCLTSETDSDDGDASVCADTDGDGCDDCSGSGPVFDPDADGTDSDTDGICDGGDVCAGFDDTLDLDADGTPDDCDDCPGDEALGADCGICQSCDGAGTCAEDLTRHDTCGSCQECTGAGTCADQTGTDVQNECDATGCFTGECTAGACEIIAEGVSCGPCQVCDAAGVCNVDVTLDSDCGFCEECAPTGGCQPQNGTDIGSDCGDGVFCNGVETCDGGGVCQAGSAPCSPCDATADACTCVVDADCPACQVCNGGLGLCEPATQGTDPKTDCAGAGVCETGTCDGAGACGFELPGEVCGTCERCDGFGACVGDATQDADCVTLCEECAPAGGSCVLQGAGTDAKDECDADGVCATGNCDGSGACEVATAGVACGTCQACDGSGVCADDLTRDSDCQFCEQCEVGGTCVAAGAGTDPRDDCAPALCLTGECDGNRACEPQGQGIDCDDCGACDTAGNCIADLTQNADCPLCEQCQDVATCVAQNSGETPFIAGCTGTCETSFCDGASGCEPQAPGVDCGVCQSCDGAGACADDLTQDADCVLCEECVAGGQCAAAGAGTDPKNECDDAPDCLTGNCDGGGFCEAQTDGFSCNDCPSSTCDPGGCVSGACPDFVVACDGASGHTFTIDNASADCNAGDTDVTLMHLSLSSSGCANDLTELRIAKLNASDTASGDLTGVEMYIDVNSDGALDNGDTFVSAGTFNGTAVAFTGMTLTVDADSSLDVIIIADLGTNPSYFAAELVDASNFTLSDTNQLKALAVTPLPSAAHSIAGRVCTGAAIDEPTDLGLGSRAPTLVERWRGDGQTFGWLGGLGDESGFGGARSSETTTLSDCDNQTPAFTATFTRDLGTSTRYLHVHTGIPLDLPICTLTMRSYMSMWRDGGGGQCDEDKWTDYPRLVLTPYTSETAVDFVGLEYRNIESAPVQGPDTAGGCESYYVDQDITSIYQTASTNSVLRTLEIRFIPEVNTAEGIPNGPAISDDKTMNTHSEFYFLIEPELRLHAGLVSPGR